MKISSRLNNQGYITFELKSETSHEETLLSLVRSGHKVTTHFGEFGGASTAGSLESGIALAIVFAPTETTEPEIAVSGGSASRGPESGWKYFFGGPK